MNEISINNALNYLKTIPQMKAVLKNLPDNITYSISPETPGIASFDSSENKITIRPDRMDLKKPQEQLSFYLSLAHELLHANQKKEGLYYDDLSNASFGDTFRIAKMMETEMRLFSAIIENELLKRKEFKECKPSVHCQYYQKALQKNGGDISGANTNFVLSYWQNGKNDNCCADKNEWDTINSHYFFYAEQAYHHALLIHNPKFACPSTNKTTASNAALKYTQRMSLKEMPSELFLQNKFDGVETTQSFQDGISILNFDGTKYVNLAPTSVQFYDKVTFFLNNQPSKVYLRHGKSGKMIPAKDKEEVWQGSKKMENLSALEIAIESNNMNRIKDIVSNDPSILNRQMPSGKRFPLLMAIQNNNAEAAAFILSKNPNLLLKTEDGKTVLDELHKLKNDKIKEQIRLGYTVQQKNLKTAFERG